MPDGEVEEPPENEVPELQGDFHEGQELYRASVSKPYDGCVCKQTTTLPSPVTLRMAAVPAGIVPILLEPPP